jgi:hypothetical protein
MIFLFGILVLGFLCVISNYRLKRMELEAKAVNAASAEYEKIMSKTLETIKDIELQLEEYVNLSLREYNAFHPELKPDDTINSTEEDVIRDAVRDMVVSRIPPIFLKKMSYHYSEDSIPDIIANKIYLIVTAHIYSHNIEVEDLLKRRGEELKRRKMKSMRQLRGGTVG